MPDSLLFLRKTIGSSPGPRLFRPRAAYFGWKAGVLRWILGERLVSLGGLGVAIR